MSKRVSMPRTAPSRHEYRTSLRQPTRTFVMPSLSRHLMLSQENGIQAMRLLDKLEVTVVRMSSRLRLAFPLPFGADPSKLMVLQYNRGEDVQCFVP
jgi:hypothetical protein